MNKGFKPTKEQLLAARNKTIPDVIAPGLQVLFCGINPGLYSAAIGHHFGRPGNRFWPALFAAGFTERQLTPFEDGELLHWKCGLTNIVNRATSAASELSEEELIRGGQLLAQKVIQYKPRVVAVLGLGAYRTAFQSPTAEIGRQEESGENTTLWVLPNPSGLNAHYKLGDFTHLFGDLRTWVENH